MAFAAAMAFADDCLPVCMHGDPHPGDIDREERAAVLSGQNAFGFNRLPVPAVEAEDAVGLRDRVPALEIGELPAMRLAGADIPGGWAGAAAPAPVLLRSPSPCPHAQDRFGIGEGDTGNLRTLLELGRQFLAH